MLQRISVSVQAKPWQKSVAQAIRSPKELLELLDLKEFCDTAIIQLADEFPLRVPRSYVKRIKPGDPNDPLLRQILPVSAELNSAEGFLKDPVGDNKAVIQNGLLQKYHGRVLVMTTAACPVHCRYCFRRHFPYGEHSGQHRDWSTTLEAIRQDTSISEAILSGGDPLSLSDEHLAAFIEALDQITHVKRLRIHSRYPVVIPERVDEDLLRWISETRLATSMVIHSNHPNEIDTNVHNTLKRLKEHGVTLLNQSVLLKDINDDVSTLSELSEQLFDAGVLPYYLHLLDRVQGAAHFEVEEEKALTLMDELRLKLPGYLVPKLVREVAGAAYKLPIS